MGELNIWNFAKNGEIKHGGFCWKWGRLNIWDFAKKMGNWKWVILLKMGYSWFWCRWGKLDYSWGKFELVKLWTQMSDHQKFVFDQSEPWIHPKASPWDKDTQNWWQDSIQDIITRVALDHEISPDTTDASQTWMVKWVKQNRYINF